MKRSVPRPVTSSEGASTAVRITARPAATRLAGSRAVVCVTSALCCALLFCAILRVSASSIRIPFSYSGDALVGLTIAKNITSGHWWWQNPRLAAPSGADWRDFPLHMHTDYAVMRLLGLISPEPAVVINLFWILAVTFTAGFATYSFLRLGIDRIVAGCIGVAYALQPFTYFRNTGHFDLVFYLVPLLAGFAVEMASKDTKSEEAERGRRFAFLKRIPVYVWIAAALQGLSYAYNSFFTCFVLLVAAALVTVVRRRLSAAAPFVVVTGVIVASFAVNTAPSFLYWKDHGKNTAIVQKYVWEAEYYGLKLRHLVTPVLDHKVPLLRKASRALEDVHFPNENENSGSRLGSLGAIGFLYLLGFISLAPILRDRPESGNASALGWLASLNIAAFLLATTGGFGALFNAFVVPDVRCYNRIVVYISYFSLCAIGLILTSAKSRWVRRRRAWPANVLLLTLMMLAVFDQDGAGGLPQHDVRGALFNRDHAFAQSIEARFEKGARIFQLPYTGFPIDERPNHMEPYEHARPYLHTSELRFSWGAIAGRDAEWYTKAASLPAKGMAYELKAKGFSAIWVDTRGYPDAASSPVSDLVSLLGPATAIDAGGSVYIYDLRKYRSAPQYSGTGSPEQDFLFRLYRNLLGRQPSADEVRTGLDSLRHAGRNGFVLNFLEASQFRATGVFTGACYLGIFGRPPEFDGWRYWTRTIANNPAEAQQALVDEFLRSPEGKSRFGGSAESSLLALSRNVLGKPPDAAAFDSWRDKLNSGEWTLPLAAHAALASPQFLDAAQKRLLVRFLSFGLLGRTPTEAEEALLHTRLSTTGRIAAVIEALEAQDALR